MICLLYILSYVGPCTYHSHGTTRWFSPSSFHLSLFSFNRSQAARGTVWLRKVQLHLNMGVYLVPHPTARGWQNPLGQVGLIHSKNWGELTHLRAVGRKHHKYDSVWLKQQIMIHGYIMLYTWWLIYTNKWHCDHDFTKISRKQWTQLDQRWERWLTMGMVWPCFNSANTVGFQLIGITTIPQDMMTIKGDEFPPWFQASNRLWSWWNWPRMMKHWYYHQILYHQVSPDIISPDWYL